MAPPPAPPTEIAAKSPTSLKVALRALRTAATLPSLERCLEMEYRVSTTFLDTHDLVEGIRAAVVDKDRSPKWDPADLGAVRDADLDRFFAARDDDIHLDPAEVDTMNAQDRREVAFFGLGNMGLPMARNLAAAGCDRARVRPGPRRRRRRA